MQKICLTLFWWSVWMTGQISKILEIVWVILESITNKKTYMSTFWCVKYLLTFVILIIFQCKEEYVNVWKTLFSLIKSFFCSRDISYYVNKIILIRICGNSGEVLILFYTTWMKNLEHKKTRNKKQEDFHPPLPDGKVVQKAIWPIIAIFCF